MWICYLNGEEKTKTVFRVFRVYRVNRNAQNTQFTQNTHAIFFAEIAVCASDKGENGKGKSENGKVKGEK